MENDKVVELYDTADKVCLVIEYLSLNSKDQGLAYILQECSQELRQALTNYPMCGALA